MHRQSLRTSLVILVLCNSPLLGADEFTEEQRNHWAWKRPASPTPPTVRDAAWARNPIDRFILARLEAANLRAAPLASPAQLLRRLSFDLIGLPPTPDEVAAFERAYSAKPQAAVEELVDRLLASPHYGERWGRHWLDLARYAESNGYEFDEVRPDAWRYRDYVIRSLNADKPYDRFLREQLAGDELYPDDRDALIATGFNLLGPDMTDSSDQAQRRLNTLNDMTDTAGLAFLGLTLACCRCHDHKFEPLPQTDYYRLQAFFTPAAFRKDLVIAEPSARAVHDKQMEAYRIASQPTREAIAALEAPYRAKLFEAKLKRLSDFAREAHKTPEAKRTPAQQKEVELTTRLVGVSAGEVAKAMSAGDRTKLQSLQATLKGFDKLRPAPLPVTMGLQDRTGELPKTFLLERGELSNRGPEVHPGYPVVLAAPAARITPPRPTTTGRRTALAEWMTAPENPLTARVIVNRLWQHHFGRGIVPTTSDFGLRGERPTHPGLLDWLATELVRSGWSLKHMHRLMLTSAAYQQSTRVTPEAREADPDNRLFSRMNRMRLEGEIIRDSLLAVSGRLNPAMGGPGVSPPIPPEALQGFKGWSVSPDPRDHVRRSVYIHARRNLRFPFLEAFDLPDTNLSCPKREQSTTAPQALALLNATDITRAADALAARLTAATALAEDRISLAYRVTLGRGPSPRELEQAREFLKQSPLRELCRGLMNVNEFVYLD
jgi:hypothetical protein